MYDTAGARRFARGSSRAHPPRMQPTSPPSEFTTPFLVTHLRRDETPGGHFRPDAVVQLTPLLRTSGLLLALPPEEVKSLLFVLSFVTPNGQIAPTLHELADAMRLSPARARALLLRLVRRTWHAHPLAYERRRDSGLDVFTLAPHLFAMRHEPAADPLFSPPPPPAPPERATTTRDAVLARSRATYARPRAEVEAEIARLNGWEYPFVPLGQRPGFDPATGSTPALPEDEQTAELRQQMRVAGMAEDTITGLLSRYDRDKIRQQLAWLPYRQAKDPARFLYSAIVHAYAEPPTLRNRQHFEAALDKVAPDGSLPATTPADDVSPSSNP